MRIFISFLIIIFLFFIFPNQRKEDKIIFLDVGQGNSVLIKEKNGVNILIDTGNNKKATESLKKELGFFDKNLDIIFISHFDYDHAGLLPYFLENYNISVIFYNGIEGEDSALFKEIKRTSLNKGILMKKVYAGKEILINEIKIKIFYPFKNLNIDNLDSNNSSLVMKIELKDLKILLTGDLEKKIEDFLIDFYKDKIKADIFLAGHHGSKNSNSEYFLKKLKPKIMIISSGENKYGHPHFETLERAEKEKIKILRTSEIGNISF